MDEILPEMDEKQTNILSLGCVTNEAGGTSSEPVLTRPLKKNGITTDTTSPLVDIDRSVFTFGSNQAPRPSLGLGR
ncbi:hypothetical protein TorRG33x02_049530 [Trema orientale]|uniref:Uncharacterized protein n=1 Tax=Trema orientale TaxID=63057 RepID=A0A2P5FNT8_TREOI|nr:hypothetical protein TorRG33x02_049530 [Trema orientale]